MIWQNFSETFFRARCECEVKEAHLISCCIWNPCLQRFELFYSRHKKLCSIYLLHQFCSSGLTTLCNEYWKYHKASWELLNEDIINLFRFSVKHYSSFVWRTIQSENGSDIVDKCHTKAHIREIRVLSLEVSATWKPIESVAMMILMVMFEC